jgi:hypothetical protein
MDWSASALFLAAAILLGCAAQSAQTPSPSWPTPQEPAQLLSPPPPGDNGKCWSDTGYHKGQPSPLCVTKLDTLSVECGTAVVFLEMRKAAAREGLTLRIVSGFRSMKEQQVLYSCHKNGKCPVAAKPGYSHHQDGLALDLNARDSGVYDWLTRNAATFGFRRTVASEPWHWERYEREIDVRGICQS